MARKKKRRNGKKRMRRNAGKKAAPKKAKKKAAKKAPKKGKKKAAKKAPKKGKKKAAKKGKKKAPKKGAKAAPKRRRRRASPKAALKSLSKSAAKAARAMGMIKGARKNPGGILDFLKAEASDFASMAPSIAVQLGTIAAVGYVASKASEQIRKRAKAGDALDKYAGVISSAGITVAAFAAMKMVKSEKVRQFSLPVLFGGMAATLVHALAAVKVKKDAAQISLGQHLGLPIGDYMALSGFVDVHGRAIAVDGMGDFVPQELGRLHLAQGPYSEGTVVSMGDYTAQELGELTLREGRFQEGTVLGEIGQMSEGRQGARALGVEGDPTIESFVDSGSLSGSVFD